MAGRAHSRRKTAGQARDGTVVVKPATSVSARPPLPASARADGAGQVLNLIRRDQGHTITELAAAMDMARSTVTERVEPLIERGFVVRSDNGSPRTGRPATWLAFNPGAGLVLAAHLGMTGARVALTDLAGIILARATVEFSIGAGPEPVLGLLTASFRDLLARAGEADSRVMGIGIGLPSMVELATARDADVAAHAWEGYSIAAHFANDYEAPVSVDQDVFLMALAEQRLRWPEANVFLCVKVGTVIGCGVVLAGEVVRGDQGMAGVIGHTRVRADETPCWCGNVGCLDAVAGGAALASALSAQGHSVSSMRDVARLVLSGLPEAVQVVRQAGREIGDVLAGVVNLLNPNVIVFWGYLAEAEEPLFAGLRETIYQRSLPASTKLLRLAKARLGEDAGTTGAALMVIEDVLSETSLNRLFGDRTTSKRY